MCTARAYPLMALAQCGTEERAADGSGGNEKAECSQEPESASRFQVPIQRIRQYREPAGAKTLNSTTHQQQGCRVGAFADQRAYTKHQNGCQDDAPTVEDIEKSG